MPTPIPSSPEGLLAQLPPPPPGRTGWPWTQQTPPPAATPGESAGAWPRISIVTPSFRQGRFIEETIRSILLQNYPNLEYHVIDGGSDDETVEILKKYEPWLSGWVSEKDRGQTHAINKGMERVSGAILAYLNSDDYYMPGAFERVARAHLEHPEADLFHGICVYVNEAGLRIGQQTANIHAFEDLVDLWGVWWQRRQFVQPEVFWTSRVASKVGPFRESLYFVMDYEYWGRILMTGAKVQYLDGEVTCFRKAAYQKSSQASRAAGELIEVIGPWLWDSSTPIPAGRRRALQARWLYRSKFMATLDTSRSKGESRLRRWLRAAGCIARHPQLMRSSDFQAKIRGYLPR